MNGSGKAWHLWTSGVDHSKAGRWQSAADALKSLVEMDPAHVGGWLRLSSAQLMQGEYVAARRSVLAAAKVAARDPRETIAVAKRLRHFEEFPELRTLLRQGISQKRVSLDMVLDAVSLLAAAGDFAFAIELMQTVPLLESNRDPRWQYQWGTLMTFVGELDRAEGALEQAIRLHPTFAQAHWMLAKMERVSPKKHHLNRLKSELKSAQPGSEAFVYLSLAAHYESHALGRFDEAWAALEGSFHPGPWLAPYSPEEDAKRFAQIKNRFVGSKERRSAPVSRATEFTPIFIVGMHRSGTSLLERILSGHPDVADAGESYAFPAALRLETGTDSREALDANLVRRSVGCDPSQIRSHYIELSSWRCQGKSFLTEKLPHNFLNIGFIAESLPEARIIHISRDPIDTCFSNLRTFFRRVGNYSYDQLHIAQFYGQYLSLMRHWTQDVGVEVCEVRYSDLVSNPEAVASHIASHCGLSFEPSMLDIGRKSGAVATASSAQVRSGIQSSRREAWKPYEAHLRPMIERLKRVAEE